MMKFIEPSHGMIIPPRISRHLPPNHPVVISCDAACSSYKQELNSPPNHPPNHPPQIKETNRDLHTQKKPPSSMCCTHKRRPNPSSRRGDEATPRVPPAGPAHPDGGAADGGNAKGTALANDITGVQPRTTRKAGVKEPLLVTPRKRHPMSEGFGGVRSPGFWRGQITRCNPFMPFRLNKHPSIPSSSGTEENCAEKNTP